MRKVRENLWLPVLLVLAAGTVLAVLLGQARDVAARRAADEDLALQALERVAAAQRAFHERERRYGWLGELRAARLLDGTAFREGPPGLAVASPGYRIEVLLPQTLVPGDRLKVISRAAGEPNAQLVRDHFVVVARPWSDDLTGWRSYASDETGRIYVNEGVSDLSARVRPKLPDLHLGRGRPTDSGGMRWWPLDDLPSR